MQLEDLKKLYVHELKDLYSAENQLVDALPRMEKAATDERLRKAFAGHREETRRHIDRLEGLFAALDFEPGGEKCRGMEGLLREAGELIDTEAPGEVKDAGLIAQAQRVEHYEIAAYGVARAYAEQLGDYDAADTLDETLSEEAEADRRLSRLALRSLNFEAMAT